MIAPAASTVAVLAVGVIFVWGAVVPLACGTIEWVFNVGGTRRPR